MKSLLCWPILSFLRLSLGLLRLYLTQLWVHLSVVRSLPSDQHQQTSPGLTINRTYLATFIAFSITTLYATLGLHLESGHPLTIYNLKTSPYYFWRHFFLKQIWPQMDIISLVVLFSHLVTLVDFAFKAVQWQHQFIIDNSQQNVELAGKALSQDESIKLLAVFRRAQFLSKICAFAFYPIELLCSYAMVFLFTQVYFVSFWSLAFWFIVWPFMLIIIALFLFLNLIHIIVSGSCIQIRQQYHIEQFAQVLVKLIRKRRPRVGQIERAWPAYQHFNQAVLSIGLQLEAFNTFYTNYLTVIFLEYTVVQVLFAYVIFFSQIDSLAMLAVKCICIVAILEMATLLLGLLQFCARVVKKNGQIGKLNRAFAVHCLRGQRRYQLQVWQLLKLELLQWPRLLHFYAFKLFGNSRITFKTFYAMAINISGFFLYVTKRM